MLGMLSSAVMRAVRVRPVDAGLCFISTEMCAELHTL